MRRSCRIGPRASAALIGVTVAVLAACGGTAGPASPAASAGVPPVVASPSAPASSATVPSSSSADIEGSFDVGGRNLWITCRGSGSPTVVFEAGLGGGTGSFETARTDLARSSRACLYDRASIGPSQPRPEPQRATAGAAADDLVRLLDAAGIDGPVILVGHSYGGMVVRLAAHRHPKSVVGLVLVDASSGHQFEPSMADPARPWMFDPAKPWLDGTTVVDREGSAVELAAVRSLGSIPLAVLTQGRMNGAFEVDWSRYQDELAALSSNALHVVARDSGHAIPDDAPELLSAVVREVVNAARDGTTLPACDTALERVGATCLASTLTARVKLWQAIRAAVHPGAGPFPAGTYRAELTGEQSAAVTGQPADFRVGVFTWTVAGRHWRVSIVTDGGQPEEFGGVYAATAGELTVRLPDGWRIPGTPGVNRLRWTRDADGTIHLEQADGDTRDDSFIVPWVPVGKAPGG